MLGSRVCVLPNLADPDSHTTRKAGETESGDTRVLSWCCTVSKSVGNYVGANKCVIEKEVMEGTLKPDLKW